MDKKLIESLQKRYATQKFDPNKLVSDKELNVLLEAIRLTPSSYGLQFIKAVVVTNKQKKDQLVEASYHQNQVSEASHVLILCRELHVSEESIDSYINTISQIRKVSLESLEGYKKSITRTVSSKSNEEMEIWINKQIYIILGNLINSCALLNIDSCPMEGFNVSEYDRILKLSQLNLTSVLVIPIGYRSEDDKYAKIEKVRKPIDEFVIYMD